MSGNEIALIPLQEVCIMANAIATSRLFGMKTKEEALALMLVAQSEGLYPARAAMEYHVIKGRPSLKAEAMLARFQKAGGKVDWKKYSDTEAVAVFSHPQGGAITVEWTIKKALTAELFVEKDGKRGEYKSNGEFFTNNWQKYPSSMLRARCISEGIRAIFPGVSVGMYTPEEVEQFDTTIESTATVVETKEVVEEKVAEPSPEEILVALKKDGENYAGMIVNASSLEQLDTYMKAHAQIMSQLFEKFPKIHARIIELQSEQFAKLNPLAPPAEDKVEK